ncbi:SRPBCC family protein [Gammaproteobacteria bacterium 45_16_T64]|nr:SRPBCC family protein [Gammaproteobacteria bacterium 45_16_T64]
MNSIMKPQCNIQDIPDLCRIEDTPREDMQEVCMEMTHSVYPHDKIYGDFCSIQEYVNAPPEKVYEYLAETSNFLEWTFSLRDMEYNEQEDLYKFTDAIGGETKCFCRTVVNPEAMTVDYHCAWDQEKQLWMIYLMRVIPAELVFGKPGSVVLWTNCCHPFYKNNPHPELAPDDRKVWVGDMWPMFYAGHTIELQNLKKILEYRHAQDAQEA